MVFFRGRAASRRRYTWILLASATSASMFPSLARAQVETPRPTQDAPADEQAAASATTEPTIVVTATRRKQLLLKVPQSITALTDKQLTDMGAQNFTDYVGSVPGIEFKSFAPGQTKITVRGISSSQGAATVGYYLNDTPITTREGFGDNQPEVGLFDVERVEILRGPQGTLYGEGSLGGTIRVITRQPNLSAFDAAGDLTGSTTESGGQNFAANAMVNIPIVEDRLALRAVAFYRNYDGWIDNISGGENINKERTKGLRIAAKLRPTEGLDITMMYVLHDLHTDMQNIAGPVRGQADFGSLGAHDDKYDLMSVTLNYDFPAATLTAVGSRFRRGQVLVNPFSTSLLTLLGGLFGVPPGTITGGGAERQLDTTDYTGEVRLVSSGERRLDWVFGAYYLRGDLQASALNMILPSNAVPFIPGGILLGGSGSRDLEHIALYGEGVYHVTDSLNLTLGLRGFNESITTSQVVNTIALNGKVDVTSVTWKGTLAYSFNDDANVYVTAASGFRSGGVNLGVDPTAPVTFKPDTTINYEIGAKTRWLGGRLTVAAALYYIDWRNVQIFIDPIPPNLVGHTDNAGAAHSAGAEIEISAFPARGLELGVNGSYTEAVIDEPVLGVVVAPAGNWLPNVPRVKGSTFAQYEFPVANGLRGRVRADVQYTGKSYASLLNTNFPLGSVVQPSYTLVNLNASLSTHNWTATLFLRNATNARAILANDTFGGFHESRPRTLGLTLRYDY